MMHVLIDYTNWRGERAMRTIQPIMIKFEFNEWHVEQQWMLYATAVDRDNVVRTFAMQNIHSWKNLEE